MPTPQEHPPVSYDVAMAEMRGPVRLYWAGETPVMEQLVGRNHTTSPHASNCWGGSIHLEKAVVTHQHAPVVRGARGLQTRAAAHCIHWAGVHSFFEQPVRRNYTTGAHSPHYWRGSTQLEEREAAEPAPPEARGARDVHSPAERTEALRASRTHPGAPGPPLAAQEWAQLAGIMDSTSHSLVSDHKMVGASVLPTTAALSGPKTAILALLCVLAAFLAAVPLSTYSPLSVPSRAAGEYSSPAAPALDSPRGGGLALVALCPSWHGPQHCLSL